MNAIKQRIEEIEKELQTLNISLNISEQSDIVDYRARINDEIMHLEQELEDLREKISE